MGDDSSPFLSQIQRLEAKLRAAQQEAAALPPEAASASSETVTPKTGPGAVRTTAIAEEAIEEAARLRQQMQRDLVARAEMQARENAGLVRKVDGLDSSLRASEAARKREIAMFSGEMSEMRGQLDQAARRSVAEVTPLILHHRSSVPGSPTRGPPPAEARLADQQWKLRAELAAATQEAQAARLAASAAQEEHQRSSTDLSVRATTATETVLRLQEEVRASLDERRGLMQQIAESRAEADSLRSAAAAKAAAHEEAERRHEEGLAAAAAARSEAEEARKAAAAAALSEQKSRESLEEQTAAALSEATRAAAGAVAASQAQAAMTLHRVEEAACLREGQLTSALQAAHAAASAAADRCSAWEERAQRAEVGKDEVRRALFVAEQAVYPCPSELLFELFRHTLGDEVRRLERQLEATEATAGELSRCLDQQTARLAETTAAAEATEARSQAELERVRADGAAAQQALQQALAAAEASAAAEAADATQHVALVRAEASALVARETGRREAAESECERLQEEVGRHAAELGTARRALQDAQRAALSSLTTARRVALAATHDCEQRVARDADTEAERTRTSALEGQLRESHAEAVAALEEAKHARAVAEAATRQALEAGRLAASQAEDERNGHGRALHAVKELQAALRRRDATVASLTLELRGCDDSLALVEARGVDESYELRVALAASRDEAAAALEASALGLVQAKAEAERAIAATAASAVASTENDLRRQMGVAMYEEEAKRAAQVSRALQELRASLEAQMAMMARDSAAEIDEFETRLVYTRVECTLTQSAAREAEAALTTTSAQLRAVREAQTESLRQSEEILHQVRRQRDEAETRAELAESKATRRLEEETRAVHDKSAQLIADLTANAARAEAAAEAAEAKAALELDLGREHAEEAVEAAAEADEAKRRLEAQLTALEDKTVAEAADAERHAGEERAALERVVDEHKNQKELADRETARLAEDLEEERERRALLQQMHEREMVTLRAALQKATGFKERASSSGSGSPTGKSPRSNSKPSPINKMRPIKSANSFIAAARRS